MRVFEEKFKLVLRDSEGRSEGLHISEVIRDLAVTCNVLDRKWVVVTLIEEQNTNMMQLGLAFENYLEYSRQHPEIQIHPGEYAAVVKGYCECGHKKHEHERGVCIGSCRCRKLKQFVVYMSPDGLSRINKEDYGHLLSTHFLHEFKFTLKSSRAFIKHLRTRSKKALMWLWQILAYCYVLETLVAKLHVMFVAGDYSYSDSDEARAAYKIFRLEFNEEDVNDNWQMLLEHAIEMQIDKFKKVVA